METDNLDAVKVVVKTTAYHSASRFSRNLRGHGKLSELAEKLFNLDITEPHKAIRIVDIVDLMPGFDRSLVTRLLTDRPGFIKTIFIQGSARNSGWYVDPKFVKEAQKRDQGYYPVDNRVFMFEKQPAEQVVLVGSEGETNESLSDLEDVHMPVAPAEVFEPVIQTITTAEHEVDRPIQVNLAALSKKQVSTILAKIDSLLEGIKKLVLSYAESAKTSQNFEITNLEKQLVYLLTLVEWLRDAKNDPDKQVLIHTVLNGGSDEATS